MNIDPRIFDVVQAIKANISMRARDAEELPRSVGEATRQVARVAQPLTDPLRTAYSDTVSRDLKRQKDIARTQIDQATGFDPRNFQTENILERDKQRTQMYEEAGLGVPLNSVKAASEQAMAASTGLNEAGATATAPLAKAVSGQRAEELLGRAAPVVDDVAEEALAVGAKKLAPATKKVTGKAADYVVGAVKAVGKYAKFKDKANLVDVKPDLNTKRDINIKDIHGNKEVIPEGEALTPYELKGNKYLLKDGDEYVVNKSQYENVKQQSVKGEAQPFAPELEGTKETVRGVKPIPRDVIDKQLEGTGVEAEWFGANEQPNFWELSPTTGQRTRRMTESEVAVFLNKPFKTYQSADPGKFAQHTLPGGENYREILVQAPEKTYTMADLRPLEGRGWRFKQISDEIVEPTNPQGEMEARASIRALVDGERSSDFTSSHWSEPNVLSHIRMNDRTYNGQPVSFIEEIQSDWAGEVRKEVDKMKNADKHSIDLYHKPYNELSEGLKKQVRSDLRVDDVPSNPLLKNWQELTAKRALKEAVDNDSEYLAWTTGKQQQDRYSLSKQVNSIDWKPITTGTGKSTKIVRIDPKDSTVYITLGIDDGGVVRSSAMPNGEQFHDKHIGDVIGKDVAEKIMAGNKGELTGEGLNIGGKWAESLYDRQLPNILKKLTGAEVEEIDIGLGSSVDSYITADSISQGQFGKDYAEITNSQRGIVQEILSQDEISRRATNQQAIRLTPEIKAMVRGEAPPMKKSSGKSPFFTEYPVSNVSRVKKTGRVIGSPGNIDTPGKLQGFRKRMQESALRGEKGKEWYEASGNAILEMFGGNKEDSRKFAQLLAIYSPATGVDPNFTNALKAWSQYQTGKPIKAGRFGQMDKTASKLLNEGIQWEGRKTNSFYNNIIKVFDEAEDVGETTIDLWMMRGLGYGTEQPSPQQYQFAENEIRRIANKLEWSPEEVQASIWLDTKAKHLGKSIDDVSPRGFAESAERNYGQLSWEAAPSKTSGLFPELHSADWKDKMLYHTEMDRVFYDKKGNDIVAEILGLPVSGKFEAPGVFEGQVSPGTQFLIPMPKGHKMKGAIEPAYKEMVDQYAAIRGLYSVQDAVAYHKPFYDMNAGANNGVDIVTKEPISVEKATQIDAALQDEFGWRVGQIPTPDGVRIINFGDSATNKEDYVKIKELVNQMFPGNTEVELKRFATDGNYISNDWKANPNGEDYRELLQTRGQDILGRSDDAFSQKAEGVIQRFSEKFGWSDNRKANTSPTSKEVDKSKLPKELLGILPFLPAVGIMNKQRQDSPQL